jgi:hypothetical protein
MTDQKEQEVARKTWAQSRDRLDGTRGEKDPERGNVRATNANNTCEEIERVRCDIKEGIDRAFVSVHEARIAEIEREGARLPMIIALKRAIGSDETLSDSERQRLLARIAALIAANRSKADYERANRAVFSSD